MDACRDKFTTSLGLRYGLPRAMGIIGHLDLSGRRVPVTAKPLLMKGCCFFLSKTGQTITKIAA